MECGSTGRLILQADSQEQHTHLTLCCSCICHMLARFVLGNGKGLEKQKCFIYLMISSRTGSIAQLTHRNGKELPQDCEGHFVLEMTTTVQVADRIDSGFQDDLGQMTHIQKNVGHVSIKQSY